MPITYFETDLEELDKSVTNGIRMALGLSGLVAALVGVLILVWPAKTAAVVAAIIAIYAAVAGLVNLAVGVFSRRLGTWPRIGYLLLGLVFLVFSGVAFANLKATAATLGVLLAILVGIAWIMEGVVGLTMIGDARSKIWTIIYALVSVAAGIVMLTSPLWGATVLWMLMGLSLLVLGLIQAVRALRFGSK